MRKLLTATLLALFGLVPALGIACEYEAATSAAATAPEQLASVQAPAATKVPASSALKAPAAKTSPKQASDKSKEPAGNIKVAVSSAD
jgi:hypothetical protein